MAETEAPIRPANGKLVTDWPKFLKRAKSFARSRNRACDADDFSQWAAERVLNGGHPKIEWLFVAFLRKNYGDTRSRGGRLRASATNNPVPIAPTDSRSDDECGIQLKSDPGRDLGNRPVPEQSRKQLSFKEEMILDYFKQTVRRDIIADILGVSPSRISQYLRSMKKKFRDAHEIQEALERLDWDKSYGFIDLEPITL